MLQRKILLILLCWSANMFAQIPQGYYNTATGSGYTLKTQLYNIIKGHTNIGYGGLWTAYATTDRDYFYENDSSILDIYSENPSGTDPVIFLYITNQCGTYTTQGNCYNREHIVPQSIFNSASPMQADAHFIVPVDGYVNGMRSDNPHGMVATANWTSLNGSKRGTSAVPGFSGTVFEPVDEFKGDIARMYFYFATRYENVVANYTTYPMFNGTSNQVFNSSFLTMLINWHTQDAVSAREITRNNAIYALQNNRNPFIDHPEYVNMIWGGGTPVPVAQTITFNTLPIVAFNNGNINLSATASSNLPITYSSSNTNVATINGSVVTITGVGTTVITASQGGNLYYLPANNVSQTLTVQQASQTISFSALVNKVIGNPPFTLVASGGGSGNPVTFTSSNPSVASVSGNTVTIVGVGTTIITASQAGNSNYLAANDVSRTLVVTNGIVAGWDMSTLAGGTGTNNFGPSPYAPTYTMPNANVSGLLRGNGLLAPTTSAAAARAWGGTINTATANSAITTNCAITFTLQAQTGYALDLGSINPFDYRRSSTGATNALVQYNINGGAYTNIGTLNFTSTATGGAAAGIIDLSSFPALQNLHASQLVTIRILPYGGTGGTFYLFDRANSSAYDISVLGNVRTCLPSSSTSSITVASTALPYIWNGQTINSSGSYTYTTINSFGCDSIATLQLSVLPDSFTAHVTAYIQGYYTGNSSMTPVLLNEGINNNPLLTDSISVELHDTLSPYSLIRSYTGILHTDGSLTCSFPYADINKFFYVVVKHRNCIETWSATPVYVSSNTHYDFSSDAAMAFGSNQVEMEPGVYAIYSGDLNADGYIDGSDYPILDVDIANSIYGVYISTDLNGDGFVDGTDYPIFDANSAASIMVQMP